MAKHIVFLLGAFDPEPSANGLCCKRIIKKLLEKGFAVDCIANKFPGMKEKETIDGVEIYRIPYVLPYKYAELLKKENNVLIKLIYRILLKISDVIEEILYASYSPAISPINVKKYINKASEIIRERTVDAIICVNMPPDAIIAGCGIKKLFPNIKFITYFLDPFSPQKLNPYISDEKYCKKRKKVEAEILDCSDIIIAQLEHETYYKINYGNDYDNKIMYLGAPLLENRVDPDFHYHKQDRYFVFAGTVSTSYRDPKFIIDVFKHTRQTKLEMYITNETTWLKNYVQKTENKNVIIHEKLSRNELEDVLKNADGFVNIGNNLELYAPSKIIEYISYGKPIISTYRTDDDTCRKYMECYPCGLYLDERAEDLKTAAQQIDELFIGQNPNINYAFLMSIYEKNTPEAFIEKCKILE